MFSETINSFWAGPQVVKAIEKREQDVLRIQTAIKNQLKNPATRLEVGLLMQSYINLTDKTEQLEDMMYTTLQPTSNLKSAELAEAVQHSVKALLPEIKKLGQNFAYDLGQALKNDFPTDNVAYAKEIGEALGQALQLKLPNTHLPAEKMVECLFRFHKVPVSDYEISELVRTYPAPVQAAYNQYVRDQLSLIDSQIKNRFENHTLASLMSAQPWMKKDLLDACYAGFQAGHFVQLKDAIASILTDSGVTVSNEQTWFLLQAHLKTIAGVTMHHNAKRAANINTYRKHTIQEQRALAIENPVQLNILQANPAHSTAKKHVTWAPQLVREYAAPTRV